MKFTDLFVKRPVLAIVVNLVILIAGLQSIRSLSVRQYPRSDIAVVTITTAYVGRNAVLPLVSQFAIAAGAVVGGAVIIEQIFVYQGVGLRLVASVNQRDYPLMQGIILMTTVCVIIANLVADLLYSRLDPRIGRAGGATGK